MNLLLLVPGDILDDGTALLTGRRHEHAREVLRVLAGETLRVGMRGGKCGTGEVVSEGPEGLRLRPTFDADPPPRAGVSIVVAIPRPKALRRVIPAVASLGVDRIVLVNAARVEKSYFDSRVLDPAYLDSLIDLGLEQARDTRPPRIEIRERLRPFVEDELDEWAGRSVRLVPHPTASAAVPRVEADRPVTLAIGPDGGWVPFEVDLLERCGFAPVSLGPRILRVEVAVGYLLGRVR
ncbi:MAG: 16S rRNA (uracil(1498)-N(3))-methyltransferase [Acidobacteria bacterium]|nr:16S rRNA (uracil(1498)-N(3))-methyltransferase [Acidobacteriota bacterium]